MVPILILCTWTVKITVLKCITLSELHLADPIQIFPATPYPKINQQKRTLRQVEVWFEHLYCDFQFICKRTHLLYL